MTLASQILADVDDVFLQLDDFASQVIRYVGGDSGNSKAITGVVTLGGVSTNDGRGRGYDHDATMLLNSDVAITVGDAIKHGDDRYEVKHVGDPQYGMRTVTLRRYQPEVKGGKLFRTGDI